LKKSLCALGFLLFSTSAFAQTPIAGPNSRYQFDFNTLNFNETGVTRFELRVDNGNWTSIGIATVILDPNTPPGETRYEHPVGVLSIGSHTTEIRACNILVCGNPSNAVTFNYTRTPGSPTLRLTQTIVVAGIIERAPYPIANVSVIDVRIPEYNVTLNFGSPTWNIPGIYSAAIGDKVFLSLSK
jgi:hypothetical protein